MRRFPLLKSDRYTFVLTPEGLELASSDDSVSPIHVPLPAGILESASEGDPSSYRLHDAEALREVVRECVARLGRRVRRAHLALDGILVRTVTLPIPFVPSPTELDLAVRSEAERYRVFAGAEVATDFRLLDSDADGVSVLLAAARREEITRLSQVFADEHIRLESIEPASLAMLRGMAALKTEAAPDIVGVIQAFPRQFHVSTWEGNTLQSWRTLYVDSAALDAGDSLAIAETSLDLQRSLVALGAAPWYLVGVPETLLAALPVPPEDSLHRLEARDAQGISLTMSGARRYGPGKGPFVFDLRRDRLKPERPPVSRAVWISAAFAALLLLALAFDLRLTRQARMHEAEASRFQAEIEAMQTTLVKPDGRQESEAALAEALTRSESVVGLFQRFQDDTPHDVWLSRAALGKDEVLILEGYSLSRQGPLNLAQALGQARSLSEIALSELAEADWQGERVTRFKLQAVFSPKGRFRP